MPGETLESISSAINCRGRKPIKPLLLPRTVTFLIKVGNDMYASLAKKQLESKSIHIIENKKYNTGCVNIIVRESDKENMIAINLGANKTIGVTSVC